MLGLAILFALGICWWLASRHLQRGISLSPAANSLPIQQEPNAPVPQKPKSEQSNSQSINVSKSSAPPAVQEFIRKTLADPQYEWKQPINFYGKVVDENNQLVANANVHFIWTDLSKTGTSEADTKSDSAGLFSLLGKKGKRLCLKASKDGYYTTIDARVPSYEYANPADNLFTPDPNNPVILHLRKKGVGVDLIISQYGVSPDFPIHIPRDGTPIRVDFIKRKTGDNGQMQITENKPEYKNWQQASSWSFRIEIPDGGFIEENDEFPFEAPETGYQPVVKFRFQQGQADWTENLQKNYYIKFGNPPLYGHLQLQTGISYGGAFLTYAINPTGSRNLEPK